MGARAHRSVPTEPHWPWHVACRQYGPLSSFVLSSLSTSETDLCVLLSGTLLFRFKSSAMTSLTSISPHHDMHASGPGPSTFTGHPCLLVDEIFDQIVRHVYAAGSGKGSVASLAATCQSFHVPAIRVLWEKMDSVVPLIKTLPDDIWVEREMKSLWDGHKLDCTVRYLRFLTQSPGLTYNVFIGHTGHIAIQESRRHST